jgi:hypothetical protein
MRGALMQATVYIPDELWTRWYAVRGGHAPLSVIVQEALRRELGVPGRLEGIEARLAALEAEAR